MFKLRNNECHTNLKTRKYGRKVLQLNIVKPLSVFRRGGRYGANIREEIANTTLLYPCEINDKP